MFCQGQQQPYDRPNMIWIEWLMSNLLSAQDISPESAVPESAYSQGNQHAEISTRLSSKKDEILLVKSGSSKPYKPFPKPQENFFQLPSATLGNLHISS